MRLIWRACFFIILLQFSACIGCCPDYECSFGELESVELKAFNNAGQEPFEVTGDDTIPARALMLQLAYRGSKMGCPEIACKTRGPFISSAYSLSCPLPEFQSPDTVDSVVIRSSSAWNQAFPAGSDLTTLFQRRHVNDFIAVGWMPDQERDYLLFADPIPLTTHRFFVDVILTDGRIFQDSTGYITLEP